jgi:hypothetical protein
MDLSLETMLRIGEILSILGGGGVVAFRIGRSTSRVEGVIKAQALVSTQHRDDIFELKTEIRKLNDVLQTLAAQQERMQGLQRQIDEMRHGRGFVVERPGG